MTDDMNMSGEGTPRWLGLAVIALAGISILGLGVGWNASTHAKGVETALATQSKTVQQQADTLGQRLSQAEETNAQLQSELNVVTDHLKLTQGELASAQKQTKQIRSDYS